MSNTNYNLLKKSFDEDLSDEEKRILSEALQNSNELRKQKDELVKIRSLLSDQDYSFGASFTDSVMSQINASEQPESDNPIMFAFNRIALPGLAAAIILLLITILGNNSSTLDAILGIESLQPQYLSEFLLFNY